MRPPPTRARHRVIRPPSRKPERRHLRLRPAKRRPHPLPHPIQRHSPLSRALRRAPTPMQAAAPADPRRTTLLRAETRVPSRTTKPSRRAFLPVSRHQAMLRRTATTRTERAMVPTETAMRTDRAPTTRGTRTLRPAPRRTIPRTSTSTFASINRARTVPSRRTTTPMRRRSALREARRPRLRPRALPRQARRRRTPTPPTRAAFLHPDAARQPQRPTRRQLEPGRNPRAIARQVEAERYPRPVTPAERQSTSLFPPALPARATCP
jgi:hypothetical protein